MTVRQELGRERERENEQKKLFRHTIRQQFVCQVLTKSNHFRVWGGLFGFILLQSRLRVVLSIHVAHQDIHVPMPEKLQAQHAKCNSSSSKQLSSSNYLPKYCELVVANHTHPYGG